MSGIDAAAPVPAGVRRTGRTVADVLRRGLDSAIANWEILAIRIAESVLIGIMVVSTILAVVIPLVISIGISAAGLEDTLRNSDTPGEVLAGLLAAHWLILVYILVAISVAMLVGIAVHSFVMAGAARVFVDADRAAGPIDVRQRFAVFTFDRWMAGGREAWWRVFWIYNIAYGIAGIVILVPLLPFAILVAIFPNAAVAVVAGCLSLILVVFLMFAVLIVTNIVCQKAIVLAAGVPVDATAALGLAWRAMRGDFVRHFAVAFIMMVLVMGGTGVLTLSSFGLAAPAMNHSYTGLLFMPVRMLMSFLSSIFSAFVGNWFLASYAALSSE